MTEKEFYEWLGSRLRELREKTKMKKVEIEEKTGISASFLSRIENGKKISTYQLNRLLEAMGYTVADLVDDNGKKNSPSRWKMESLPA